MFGTRQLGITSVGLALVNFAGSIVARAAGRVFEITKSDAEWKAQLSVEQYRVLRQQATERAGTSPLVKQCGVGTYHCAACDQPLFKSETKFDSGTGWPSFKAAIDDAVVTSTDFHMIVPRTEASCSRCGGHLGHIFKDGPRPNGLRYCMNGAALRFSPNLACAASEATAAR